jgi:hypothetical protein
MASKTNNDRSNESAPDSHGAGPLRVRQTDRLAQPSVFKACRKKQTVVQSHDKSSPYHLNLAQICDRQPFFFGADTRGEIEGKNNLPQPNPL